MLVLSRKENESIFIGDDIEVIVTKIGGGRIRLGIKAPDDVPILRSEVRAERETETQSQKKTQKSSSQTAIV